MITQQPTRTPWPVVLLMGLCVLVFMIGGYQVTRQAQQIGEIIDAQSPLIFSFENVGQTGEQRVTFIVTCNLAADATRYICVTETPGNPPRPPTTPPTPRPTP